MQITTTISDSDIYNLLCSANYGAISYWVDKFDWTPGTDSRRAEMNDIPGPLGHCEAAPLTGGCWTIWATPQNKCKRFTLDRVACELGLAVMAAKYPRHFADLIGENDDATTADVFIQCCLFGELIFG